MYFAFVMCGCFVCVCVCVCEYLCVCVFICHKVKVFNFQYLLTPGADLRGRLRGFLRQEEGLKGEIYPPPSESQKVLVHLFHLRQNHNGCMMWFLLL